MDFCLVIGLFVDNLDAQIMLVKLYGARLPQKRSRSFIKYTICKL